MNTLGSRLMGVTLSQRRGHFTYILFTDGVFLSHVNLISYHLSFVDDGQSKVIYGPVPKHNHPFFCTRDKNFLNMRFIKSMRFLISKIFHTFSR